LNVCDNDSSVQALQAVQ